MDSSKIAPQECSEEIPSLFRVDARWVLREVYPAMMMDSRFEGEQSKATLSLPGVTFLSQQLPLNSLGASEHLPPGLVQEPTTPSTRRTHSSTKRKYGR